MSIQDVRVNWPSYCLLTKIMSIDNDKWEKIVNNNGTFPENTPGKWEEWANSVERDFNINETVDITKAALGRVSTLLAESHNIASTISITTLSEDTIKPLIKNLDKLNEAIKSDQRFHAAIAIGLALSEEIKKKHQA